ncbi:MAG: hypothetical protein JXD21_04395 [Candidatus Omnitrophica bacterium]|nr:hypothetical protein [Candidatus Omnitrophota bacterium]
MRPVYLKLSVALLFLLGIDFLNPFLFSLKAELLYLGILFIAFHSPIEFALTNALVLGLVKDRLVFAPFPFYTVFFLITCIGIGYFVKHFHPRVIVKTLGIAGILLLYGLYNSILVGQLSVKLLSLFILQSIALYHLLHYIMFQWIHDFSTG